MSVRKSNLKFLKRMPADMVKSFHMTEDEYLAFEATSEGRHEYINGLVRPMASNWNHSCICTNTLVTLHRQLQSVEHYVVLVGMRLGIDGRYLSYRYPDVLVTHNQPVFFKGREDAIADPVVIVEVVSTSSERIDRGQKMDEYFQIESLQEYILIADDTMKIEHYRRYEDDTWLYRRVTDAPGQISLTSIDCYLTLADVYDDIDFERFANTSDEIE